MGMLDRYKKPGGFVQLLMLIETSGKDKREKFLKIIGDESPLWADTLTAKMLTLAKVFSWDDNTIAEIAARIHELSLAVALHGFDEAQKERLLRTFSHHQKRRIMDLHDEKKPSPVEVSAAFTKILEEVRQLISHGYLRMDKIDPSMVIEEEIEEKLNSGAAILDHSEKRGEDLDFSLAIESGPGPDGGVSDKEFQALKVKLVRMTQENSALRSEIKAMRERFDQIKRIAS